MFLGRTDIERFMSKYTLYLCSLYLALFSFFFEDRVLVLDGRGKGGWFFVWRVKVFFPAPGLKLGR